MSMAEPLTLLKVEWLQTLVPQLVEKLAGALDCATPLHEVQRQLWEALLATGHQGPTLTLPDGQEVSRLDQLHSRRYGSIFGEFTLPRTVYGSREGRALEFVPLG